MSKDYKIEVVHDETSEVVKTLAYETEMQRDKAYDGLIRNMNLGEYTAVTVGPSNGRGDL